MYTGLGLEFVVRHGESAMSAIDRYRIYLDRHHKRFTRERRIVADAVFAYHRAFGIEELIDDLALRSAGQRVSRSTVFRAVNEMTEARLLCHFSRLGTFLSLTDRMRG